MAGEALSPCSSLPLSRVILYLWKGQMIHKLPPMSSISPLMRDAPWSARLERETGIAWGRAICTLRTIASRVKTKRAVCPLQILGVNEEHRPAVGKIDFHSPALCLQLRQRRDLVPFRTIFLHFAGTVTAGGTAGTQLVPISPDLQGG